MRFVDRNVLPNFMIGNSVTRNFLSTKKKKIGGKEKLFNPIIELKYGRAMKFAY